MIPVENVYYLFAYAWELWPGGPPRLADAPTAATPPDLFARMFVAEADRLLKRGPPRAYAAAPADVRSPRGKLAVGETVKRALLRVPAARCETDELRYDTPLNRVVKATLRRVAAARGIDRRIRADAAGLARRFPEVPADRLTAAALARLRPAPRDRVAAGLARVLFHSLLADDRAGTVAVRDVLRDEALMPRVFEAFVRNFYRREQAIYPRVGERRFAWQDVAASPADRALLPGMRTDACLEAPGRAVVIDAKFYAAALSAYFDAPAVHAANLYQLFAYLTNLEAVYPPGTELTGLLLYPTTGRELDLDYALFGRRVRVGTADLSRPWPEIHRRLLGLVGAG